MAFIPSDVGICAKASITEKEKTKNSPAISPLPATAIT